MEPSSLPNTPVSLKGFTLVEVMVAMVIGMIGLIVMMQVFSAAEGQRRATTGTGDAQSNGAMALYALQRDIRQAGYGFNAVNVLGCPLALTAHTLEQFAPVVINPPDVAVGSNANAFSDILLVAYGNNEGPPEGDAITALVGTKIAVRTAANYHDGQQVIAAPPANETTPDCPLTLAKIVGEPSPNITVTPTIAATDSDTLFNLGANPKILAFAVRADNLTVCDYMTKDCSDISKVADQTVWVPIANNIVSLRAQYRNGTGVWNQATPDPATPTAKARACLWRGIQGLRLAVVARNSQVDRDPLKVNEDENGGDRPPLWAGSADAPIDLTARSNWKNYRYKVFETVVPLRNLPWMSACP